MVYVHEWENHRAEHIIDKCVRGCENLEQTQDKNGSSEVKMCLNVNKIKLERNSNL